MAMAQIMRTTRTPRRIKAGIVTSRVVRKPYECLVGGATIPGSEAVRKGRGGRKVCFVHSRMGKEKSHCQGPSTHISPHSCDNFSSKGLQSAVNDLSGYLMAMHSTHLAGFKSKIPRSDLDVPDFHDVIRILGVMGQFKFSPVRPHKSAEIIRFTYK